jgi:hypothetical protein
LSVFVCFGGKFEEKTGWKYDRKPGIRIIMITDRLGKWLFPKWQPYRRERETKTLMVALLAGLVVAGIMAAILILTNSASLGR